MNAKHTAGHVTVLGIAGSLRRTSYNRAVLRTAQSLTPQGPNLEIFEMVIHVPPRHPETMKRTGAANVQTHARIF